jgi:phosphatidate cytidylyltransferase
MLRQRLLVTLIALPIGIAIIAIGGWLYADFIALLLGRAAWEYAGLFHTGGSEPAKFLLVGGVVALVAARVVFGFSADNWLLVLIILLAMLTHLISFERGRDQSGSDFAITLSGVFYIGLLGSYFVSVRQLPNGLWWLLFTLFAVWIADSAAYLIGTPLGKHKMTPRLSPKKSWEGYAAGLVFSTLLTPLFLFLFRRLGLPADPSLTWQNIAVLAFAIAALTTLGDLGESMIKRQVRVKDASQLLPGHGGILDRIDSWLWALPIAYYLITFVFLNAV